MKFLCFDVGGTFVKYALFNEQADFLAKDKYPTDSSTPDKFFTQMAQIASQYDDLTAIGISFPGFINTETGVAVRAGALGQLDGQNIVAALQAKLNHPVPIAIENDAKCAALAEKLNGNAQDVHDFAVITLGTGVGGGIVINDEVLHGEGFRADEFGMMVTDYTSRGVATLHDLASTSALVKSYATAKKLPVDQVSGEQIMADLANPETKAIVENWAVHVAIAIFNLVVTNAPQRILIGGGISQNPLVMPFIKAALKKMPSWSDFHADVVVCAHHNDSGLIGALALATKTVKEAS
ncbi:ROK family protein [Lapidilactobacillus gannanensis]|uniref:ROK family protein n=1 Tax=Lapidilactobacillus gannanensis TaxID=2486002 RepID=A0ABW4BJ99_9LACO|nr:ROK family protein [Lapidilactobacillus gannanensis]